MILSPENSGVIHLGYDRANLIGFPIDYMYSKPARWSSDMNSTERCCAIHRYWAFAVLENSIGEFTWTERICVSVTLFRKNCKRKMSWASTGNNSIMFVRLIRSAVVNEMKVTDYPRTGINTKCGISVAKRASRRRFIIAIILKLFPSHPLQMPP